MSLSFLSSPYLWDGIFVLILLICIRAAAKCGAFRAFAGMTGTLLGILVGNHFQEALVPKLEPVLAPVLEWFAQRADLSALTGLEQDTVLYEIVTRLVDTRPGGVLYDGILSLLAQALARSLAPVLAFLILFFGTKLALRLLCLLLDLDLPILSGINRFCGGLLGAAAGLLTVLALCWAVMRYAPEAGIGLLNRHCLLESYTGALLGPLFESIL